MTSMNINDLPSQRRPPTQTYARLTKRPKLHHGNQRYTDEPATQPEAPFRREVGDPAVLEVEPVTKVDEEVRKKEDNRNAEVGGVLQDLPIPVLSTNTATMAVEDGGSRLVRTTKGRTPAPMVGPRVRRGPIDAYFMRMPVEKKGENIEVLRATLVGVANTATSTASSTTPETAMATLEPTLETPSALATTQIIIATCHNTAGATSTQARASNPMATPIPNSSPQHKPSPTPSSSSVTSPSPASSPLFPTPTTTRRKRRRPNLTQPQAKKLTQLHLDLGQTPSRTTCPTCHMSYDPSLPEDTLLHNRFHAKSTGGVDFISSRPRILWSGVGFVQDSWEGGERESVIVVGRNSNKLERRRVMKVMEIVERELGCQEIKEEEMFGVLKYDAKGVRERDRGGDEGGRYKVFLYLLGRKCVGLLLAEKIERAYKITLPSFPSPASFSISPSTISPAPIDPSDNCPSTTSLDHPLTLSPTPSPALLGISRIWTCSTYRRRGIATRLLDVARQAFIYGMTIDKCRVAFSQPTALGRALAGEWFLREGNAVKSVGKAGVEHDGLEGFVEERRGETRVGLEKGVWLVYLDGNCVLG
ncbi:ESCO1/2 acetyl-transferase-domain-containing protein [Terfezia claveryi]|nr:ESCO1/2 acetyl-transferase-domain-containing protein [Terfezia claveryi]